MRLIADGAVERGGVKGLADHLGYSTRQLNRILVEELGAGPLALARSQRAHTARSLIESTGLRMTDVSYAAGFSSVRQFNHTIREVYAQSPTELRDAAGRPNASNQHAVRIHLAARQPFDYQGLLDYFTAHAINGTEHVENCTYRRSLRLPSGHGVAALTFNDDGIDVELTLQNWSDLQAASHRIRSLCDLHADTAGIESALSADPALADIVARRPGLRVVGSPGVDETVFRTIIGQQVSVAGARTVAERLVARHGEDLAISDPYVTKVFPGEAVIASIDPGELSMPRARAATMIRVAQALVDGGLMLGPGVCREHAVENMLAIKGVGPWTAKYVALRALGDPDVMLDTDLGVIRALEPYGVARADIAARAAQWAPWRSYATTHLWLADPKNPNMVTGQTDAASPRTTQTEAAT